MMDETQKFLTSSSKYQRYDKVKSLYNNVMPFDDLRVIEMKEIEEEEAYIDRIRRQREKMEIIKQEWDKKDKYYVTIERENQKLRPYFEKFNKMKELLEDSLMKMERKDIENKNLRNEIEELQRTLENFNVKIMESEMNKNLLKEELEKMQSFSRESEETLYLFKKQTVERERTLTEQLYNMKSNENSLKGRKFFCELKFLNQQKKIKEEVIRLQDQEVRMSDTMQIVQDLKEENIRLEKENLELMEKLKISQKKIKERSNDVENVIKENRMLKEEFESRKAETMREYQDLQEELDRQEQLIKRQESMIHEFRQYKHEQDKLISSLRDDLANKDRELMRSKELNSQLSEEYNMSVNKLQEFEIELSSYRKENHELKKNLSILLEKEENERLYRQELEKVKLDILTARNMEVEKLNEAFENIIPGSRKSKGSERRMKNLQDSEDRQKLSMSDIFQEKEKKRLPYVINRALTTTDLEIENTRKELEDLERQIKDSKIQLATIFMSEYIKKKDIQPEEKDRIKGDFTEMIRQLEEKRSRIVSSAINLTLKCLKEFVMKFEKNEEVSLSDLKTNMRVCRSIISKSIEELTSSISNQKEKPLFMMLKVFAEKCLEKIVEKVKKMLENLEAEENDDKTEESSEEEVQGREQEEEKQSADNYPSTIITTRTTSSTINTTNNQSGPSLTSTTASLTQVSLIYRGSLGPASNSPSGVGIMSYEQHLQNISKRSCDPSSFSSGAKEKPSQESLNASKMSNKLTFLR